MKNIFLFGASIVHGLGGPQGGWADKIKLSLYRDMYGEDASGEASQVYELGVPNAVTADLLARFEAELAPRLLGVEPQDTVLVIQSGTNDAKAVGDPEGYVVTPEDFEKTAMALVDNARKYSAHVLVVGLPPCDERKVRPKHNPITGTKSYFSNARIKQFEDIWRQVCDTNAVTFIPLHDAVPENWVDAYLFTDGIHPNDKGHRWIQDEVEPVVRRALEGIHD